MKKFAAGATAAVFAVSGLTALTVAPATASPYANCDEVYAAGKWRIPASSSDYAKRLDGDGDGFACDNIKFKPTTQPTVIADPVPTTPPVVGQTQPVSQAWDNCTEAFNAGVSNIPATDPKYGKHLDSDLDGIGCELAGDDDAAFPVAVYAASYDRWVGAGQVPGIAESQVGQVPVGGADTGVPMTPGSRAA